MNWRMIQRTGRPAQRRTSRASARRVFAGAAVSAAAVLLAACATGSAGAPPRSSGNTGNLGATAGALAPTATPATSPAAGTSTGPGTTDSGTTDSATASGAASPTGSPTATGTASTPSTTSDALAQRVFGSMSTAERVGQLLMIDNPSTTVSQATTAAIANQHIGSVILDGNSLAGAAVTKTVTASLENANPSRAALFIATDQEGGIVQRLKGTGFDTIPSAVRQGALTPATIRKDAQRWGSQLKSAGVNVDLGPVLDVVPAGAGANPPIGDLDRQYGSTPAAVSSHALAFAAGLKAAGVVATVKHFPGLGRVHQNTDTTANVTDTVTTADDAFLQPYRAAIAAGVPFVMVSTAIYAKIDPASPAAFSRPVITGLLRGTFGFTGVVISDDLGAARQVSAWAVGDRAVDFIAAGGDIALTVNASQAATMANALLAKAKTDPAFAAQVNAAALRVLQAKANAGLLS